MLYIFEKKNVKKTLFMARIYMDITLIAPRNLVAIWFELRGDAVRVQRRVEIGFGCGGRDMAD